MAELAQRPVTLAAEQWGALGSRLTALESCIQAHSAVLVPMLASYCPCVNLYHKMHSDGSHWSVQFKSLTGRCPQN